MKILTEEDEEEDQELSKEFSDYSIELDESEQITQDDFEEEKDS